MEIQTKLKNEIMNRRRKIIELQDANNRLLSENIRLNAAQPANKFLCNVVGLDGKVSEYVFDKNTVKYMGRHEHSNIMVDLYVTIKGNMLLHKHNPITKQWTYFLPNDEEKEIYANALIDHNKLIEL